MATVDAQYSMWETQKSERLRLGDDLTAPRPIEHFAHFARKRSALGAADALADLGFDVSIGRSGFKSLVSATRPETLTDDSVRRFLAEIVAVIESHRGDYDGWGAHTAG